MRIVASIIGIIMVVMGLVWTLQGANILGGSVMSGHTQWLYVGIAVVLVGLVLLYWFNIRGRRPLR
jgi:uncharacterized membrane protein YidH (DUF202 family)